MYLKTSFFSWDQPLKNKPTAKIRFGRPIGENVYDFFSSSPPYWRKLGPFLEYVSCSRLQNAPYQVDISKIFN